MRFDAMNRSRILKLLLVLGLYAGTFPATPAPKKSRAKKPVAAPSTRSVAAAKKVVPSASQRSAAARSVAKKSRGRTRLVAGGPWLEPTYADSTIGDNVDGEDLVVRRAAVAALGPLNGSVVVADPHTGRILTMVNQKVALSSGFQPCSTIKIFCALAGLSEGIIERNTMMRIYGRATMNLTDALAHSNNAYFANLGIKLGFERVLYYAKLYGLGENAGLGIEGEQPGILPEAPPALGGVGMMTSFGEGITLTPLQLASILSAMANGGTIYWLQTPRTQAEIDAFVPKVKRHLDIQQFIPEITPGMMGAVEYGTARRASYDPNEPILGKTGTCTDRRTPTHLGWFGSFNEVGRNKLVVVVLLTGGKPSSGSLAAEVAGNVYRNLSEQNFFAHATPAAPIHVGFTPTATPPATSLFSTQSCCAQ